MVDGLDQVHPRHYGEAEKPESDREPIAPVNPSASIPQRFLRDSRGRSQFGFSLYGRSLWNYDLSGHGYDPQDQGVNFHMGTPR
jgi:hypothetical protein